MKLGDLVDQLDIPADQMQRISKMISNAAAPINDVIKNSAVAKLMAASQQELDKMVAPLKKLQLDPAIFKVPMAGPPPLPNNPHWPALSQLPVVELRDPVQVKVELPEPVVPDTRWWKQGWVLEWIAIGIAIALGVIGILT